MRDIVSGRDSGCCVGCTSYAAGSDNGQSRPVCYDPLLALVLATLVFRGKIKASLLKGTYTSGCKT